MHPFLSSTMSYPPHPLLLLSLLLNLFLLLFRFLLSSSLTPSILYYFLPRSVHSVSNRMSALTNEHVSRRYTLTRLYGEHRCQYDYVHFGASPFPLVLDSEPRLQQQKRQKQQQQPLRLWQYLDKSVMLLIQLLMTLSW